ncbi:hypothetical protein V5799_012571 [Amblyomma americanum]|uniref:Uncharacterized protein n=1 Tax=Amblyomma americanum TaxID=6943 RepID=A0AAQ4EDM7_AMBAM
MRSHLGVTCFDSQHCAWSGVCFQLIEVSEVLVPIACIYSPLCQLLRFLAIGAACLESEWLPAPFLT